MRILHVSRTMVPALSWGGPPRAVWNLAKAQAAAGHPVHVLTTEAEQRGAVAVPRFRVDDGVAVTTCPVVGRGSWPAANRAGVAPQLWARLRTAVRGADVVHITGVWDLVSWAAGLVCREEGRPYVVSPRGHLDRGSFAEKSAKKWAVHHLWLRRMLAGAAGVHCTTDDELRRAAAAVPPGAGFVVPNIVDAPRWTGKNRALRAQLAGDKPLLVGVVGRVHPVKGYHLLIAALAAMAHRDAVQVVWIGTAEGRYGAEAARLAAQAGVAGCLRFLGAVDYAALMDHYRAVDVLVVPSKRESFGNVVVEAASQGVPCVVTQGVALRDWVRTRDVGKVVDPDAAALAAALDAEVETGALRRIDPHRLVRAAGTFSAHTVAQNMIAQYEDRCARAGSRQCNFR